MPGNVTPQILDLSNQFRAQLLARERRAASAMVRYYGSIWAQMQGDISALQSEVEAMIAAGEEVGAGMLARLDRMRAIRSQAAEQLERFSEFAGETISAGQRESIIAGERDAYGLLQASFPEGAEIELSFARLPSEAVEAMVGFLQDGSPLLNVIQGYVGGSLDAFGEMMVTGLAAGWNPRRLARQIRGAFGMGLTESLRLARTEQLRAYRAATQHSYNENSHVVTEWERIATQDDRTCMACIALDGKRYRLGEPMDDHPQGRCAMVPITKTWEDLGIDAEEPDFRREMGQDWFARQDEATQRAMMDTIGKQVYDAWQDGRFELSDIPQLIESDVWGNHWTPATQGQLIGE